MILDYRVRVNGRMELFTIYVSQDDCSPWEGLFHLVWTLIWWCELSSHVWKGCVPFLQDEVPWLEGARSSLFVVSPLNSPLIELPVAQRHQSLLIDEVQLLITRLGPLSFIQLGLQQDSQGRDFHFNWQYCFHPIHQWVRCSPNKCPHWCLICAQSIWQMFVPIFIRFCHLAQNLLYILVGSFHDAVHLWVVWSRVVVLDLELLV